MEAARTSETSVDNYFTRQYIPEDNSELHTRRRENLKSHKFKKIFFFKFSRNVSSYLHAPPSFVFYFSLSLRIHYRRMRFEPLCFSIVNTTLKFWYLSSIYTNENFWRMPIQSACFINKSHTIFSLQIPVYSIKYLFEIVLQLVDVGLLGCNALWTYRKIPTFRRNILPPSSELNSTRRYNLD
jgi:hypothetical protein